MNWGQAMMTTVTIVVVTDDIRIYIYMMYMYAVDKSLTVYYRESYGIC